MGQRYSYSFVELEISAAAYDEIAGLLRAVGYDVFVDGAIDMHGFGLTKAKAPEVSPERPHVANGECRPIDVKTRSALALSDAP